jgi:hypothetical protein
MENINRAEDCARASLANIMELQAKQDKAENDKASDDVQQAILELPLSVETFTAWEIMLSTGGPAVRIVGRSEDGCPRDVRLQSQDWGTPWTDVQLNASEQDSLGDFIRQFIFE